MPDADRVREQVEEMKNGAEITASVADRHREIAVERKAIADREVNKMALMLEVFTMGEQALVHRKQQLIEAEEKPAQEALTALDDALANVRVLQKQAQKAITHNEGASMTLDAMAETFAREAQEATGRARSAQARGAKAVEVAERRETPVEPQGAPAPQPVATNSRRGVPGFLDVIDRIQGVT